MTLVELMAAVATHTASEAGRAEFVARLQQEAQPVYQAVFSAGAADARTAATAERTALETRATTAETERDQARARVTELESRRDTPDITRLREQHATELQRVQTESTTRETAVRQTLQAERQRWGLDGLRRELVAAGVDPYMADTICERPSTAARMRFGDADGQLAVLQAGAENITLQVASDSTPLRAYAAELKGGLDARWLTSAVQAGPGSRTDFTPAPATNGGYDPAAEGRKMGETQAARTAPTANSLALK